MWKFFKTFFTLNYPYLNFLKPLIRTLPGCWVASFWNFLMIWQINVVTIKTGFISYLKMEHRIKQRLSDIRGSVSVIVATWKLKPCSRCIDRYNDNSIVNCTKPEKLCSFFKKLVHFLAKESNCCLEVWARRVESVEDMIIDECRLQGGPPQPPPSNIDKRSCWPPAHLTLSTGNYRHLEHR